MKKLLFLLCMWVSLSANAAELINGIYYNLNTYTNVAQVTSTPSGSTEYSGNIVIPSIIRLNNQQYEVKSIGPYAFYLCTKITSVTIPNSVLEIRENAFWGCGGLKKAEFSSAESLLKISFENEYANPLCHAGNLYISNIKITDFTIPGNITTIGDYAFSGINLSSLTIPNTVKSIGRYAFSHATCDITQIMGTPTIKYSNFAFYGFKGDVIAPAILKSSLIDNSLYSNYFYASDGSDLPNHIKPLLKGFVFSNPYFETILKCKNLKFYDAQGTQLSCTKTDAGYLVKGLKINKEQTITASYTDGSGTSQGGKFNVTTLKPSLSISYRSTQTTITINEVTATSDESCLLTETGVNENITLPYVFTGFGPSARFGVSPYAKYDGEYFYGYETLNTSPLGLSLVTEGTSTTLKLKGTYMKGDAMVSDKKITVNGKTYEGDSLFLSGLEPNESFNVFFSVKTNNTYTYTTQPTLVYTAPLEMKTAAPKIITEGNAIIAAQTNISDVEKNVGFEWRRTDWTDDFASNTASAFLYKGKMEGYIRNINSSKLWKYRPYYLSDSGKYFYGDWMGLDASNTNYFEATVHTYDEIQIEGNTALVKGYALRGTDNIKVQGFVYWKKANATRAKGFNGDTQIEAMPADAMRVEATGQIMTATLTGLDYSTEYCYMAFATTIEGETFYGEEMSFKTAEGKVCATPTIDFVDGVITCTSETAGAECHYTYSITGEGMNNGTVNSKKIEISAIAKAEGYTDSEKVTKTFDYTTSIRGDVDGDGIVTMKDANAVVNIYLRK